MVPHVLVQTPGTITSGQHSGTVDDNGLRRRGDAQGPGLLQYKIGVGARAGVAVPTLRRFEVTGQISLERLLKLAAALDLLEDFDRVAAQSNPAETLGDVERSYAARTRQRGRTIGRSPS